MKYGELYWSLVTMEVLTNMMKARYIISRVYVKSSYLEVNSEP